MFSEGEIRHFIRDSNWSVKAPGSVRTLGLRGRYLLRNGSGAAEVCEALNVSAEELRLALFSVQSLDHETMGFAGHLCPRPTPWEHLEAEEQESPEYSAEAN